ncbi:ATP-binding protein [Nitratidesulfovibrio sp. 1201_IL3209]|uniref:ATP-binding protein n=1 Tax=Nitratidesulfovibrio sp. 1201_IL3209 TaxID=3084053 RepID=UPI002FD8C7F4
MKIPKDDLIGVLAQFNPWWRGEPVADLPAWRRAAFRELHAWVAAPPAPRAVLVSGARQVGKTTLMLQSIAELIAGGVPPANILYATFDHPLFKLAGIEAVLEAWRAREPALPGPEFLFLDEGQFIRDWGTWVKHQVDFFRHRRIAFTGSALPLLEAGQESGVGRWHTIKLTTLSFYEYLQLKRIPHSEIPPLRSLRETFAWPQGAFYRVAEMAAPLVGHFHDYLVRGGFPQIAQVESVTQAQRLLREDVIDKVLKRDMTVLFGVRRVLDLEHTFLYLCMHDGGLLDVPNLCKNLEVKRPTALKYIDLLESTHLVYKLPPHGYGKDILRARYKVYLADAALAPAALLKGKGLIDDPVALGVATETAVFKHLFARYYARDVRFTYWRDKKNREVDLVADMGGKLVPFEVKYRAQHAGAAELQGLLEFMRERKAERGYAVTKSLADFGPLAGHGGVMRIPAPLLCYWMGQGGLDEPIEA